MILLWDPILLVFLAKPVGQIKYPSEIKMAIILYKSGVWTNPKSSSPLSSFISLRYGWVQQSIFLSWYLFLLLFYQQRKRSPQMLYGCKWAMSLHKWVIIKCVLYLYPMLSALNLSEGNKKPTGTGKNVINKLCTNWLKHFFNLENPFQQNRKFNYL